MAIRETLSTLQFAERAKKIKNKAVVNEEANYQKKYFELMKEVEMLRKGQVPQQVVIQEQVCNPVNDQAAETILQLQEENEEILAKLAQWNQLEQDRDEIARRLEEIEEEYSNSQKALEYYQTDMIPHIKRNTELLQKEIENLQTQNESLRNENQQLRGNFDD